MGRERAAGPSAPLDAPRGVLLLHSASGAPAWADALAGVVPLAVGERLPTGADAALRASECALVDANLREPLALIRRLHSMEPTLQMILVVSEERRSDLERAMLFSPGLGEVWVASPAQTDAEMLARASEVTRQRRRFRGTRARVTHEMAASEPSRVRRTLISDAYLAALLRSIPDPVISLDEEGRVLSWNEAAERVLDRPRSEAEGRNLPEVLTVSDRRSLDRLLEEGGGRRAAGEIRFRRRSGEEAVGEITVLPVEAAGHHVRCVLLHDLTEERRLQEELEAQASELEAQTAELEMLNEEMRERTVELEDALATRSRFYAAMSHELRTPINAILGYNDLLLAGVYGSLDEKQTTGIERSQRAARHLMELVNDVLDLAKIEAGRVELQPEPVALPHVLEDLLDTIRPLADQNGSQVVVEGPPAEHSIETDPRRLRQILLNLLSNAVKFGEGKDIHLRWDVLHGGGVSIEVADQGEGIDPADLKRIFEEFEQVRPQEGTGLGLPISRRLAEVLGGELTASSEPGRGSTFRVVLPASLPASLNAPQP